MERPKHLLFLNYASVIAFLIVLALCAWQFWSAIFLHQQILGNVSLYVLVGIPTLFIAYLAADFLSGFVHFLGDSFGDIDTPIVGKTFIFPFREHHVDQKAITRHDFFETNGHNCLVSIPVLLVEYFLFPEGSLSLIAFAFFLFLFGLVLFVFCTNQFHKWAHEDHPNDFAQLLQSHGWILTPTRHNKHHTPPFESHFCITTGWLNEALEKVHFFSWAKRTLAKIPGIPEVYEPNKKSS